METQPQITCQGLAASPHVLAKVDGEIEKLEKYFGHITACRVLIRAASERRHTGDLFEVSVHLTLPLGREVTVSRTHADKHAHADVLVAIRDAFRAARRQLQDEARTLRGDVKHHRAAAVNRIKAGAIEATPRLSMGPAPRNQAKGREL